ncbi:MAG: hypothetical protein ABSH51_06045 [Solirubrobacteraceae bacterium]|jgi:hypothetical protein
MSEQASRSLLERAGAMTRRALLQAGGGAALTLAGGRTAERLVGLASATDPVWSRRSYRRLMGHAFTVHGSQARLHLASIENLPDRPAGSDGAFALTFRAPAAVRLPHGLPSLHHPALGRFEMFLVPGDGSGPSTSFRAVIDRTHA